METRSGFGSVGFVRATMLLAAASAAPVAGQVTSRVSVDSTGAQGNNRSFGPSISSDGRYVAFASSAGNLVGGDTNGFDDIFVRDRHSGTTERVSVDSGGVEGNGVSSAASISADGRYVAFASLANNLVPGDANGAVDVFVRDRQSGTTERVSVDSAAVEGDSHSGIPSISADGRYVTFSSVSTNLVGGDTNGVYDVFVRDRQSGTTERVSVDSSGAQGNGDSGSSGLWVSADGRYVAFASSASNLVSVDTNGFADIFVRDRQSGVTERASVDSLGVEGNDMSSFPRISADGRYVAFESLASNLVGGDTGGWTDIFVHDRQSGTTERASLDSAGAQANGHSNGSSISADGRHVAFQSLATNLVSGDTNLATDVFIRDRQSASTERASVDTSGAAGNGNGIQASVSADGRYVVFTSAASNLVGGDTNGFEDVFARDRDYSPFATLCDAGTGGVIACPCSNPSGGPDRGCDNSAGTGGAILSASGVAYLSTDTLVFTASGVLPSEMSIVVQGSAPVPSGLVYGQGVRCVGGSLERLYVKTASGGSITAPDFGAGDPSVSARSAARGDPIQPAQSRWYYVYYRDPSVLGGCPASSTFNATQTGEVAWLP